MTGTKPTASEVASDRVNTAYHEAGHVLAASVWNGNLRSVTIKSNLELGAKGHVVRHELSPDITRGFSPKHRVTHFLGEVRVYVAGYAAIDLYTGKRPEEVNVLDDYDEDYLEPDFENAIKAMAIAYPRDTSSATRLRIAAEYELVVDFLVEQRTSLDSLASALLKHETLEGNALYEALGNVNGSWIGRGMPMPSRRRQVGS